MENYKHSVTSMSCDNCVIFVPYFLIAYDFAVGFILSFVFFLVLSL
jgi:hypothetical protein